MNLKNLDKDELKDIAIDFLRLRDLEFASKFNMTKQNVGDDLDADPKLADAFNEVLKESFSRKMVRECYASIAYLTQELRRPGVDMNIQRINQQSLQTLMVLQKSLGTVKDKSNKGNLGDILEELENSD